MMKKFKPNITLLRHILRLLVWNVFFCFVKLYSETGVNYQFYAIDFFLVNVVTKVFPK
jgi:hypothetical protein